MEPHGWLVEAVVFRVLEFRAQAAGATLDATLKPIFDTHLQIEQADPAQEVMLILAHDQFVTISIRDHREYMRLILSPAHAQEMVNQVMEENPVLIEPFTQDGHEGMRITPAGAKEILQ